jgi:hypothetical protein
VAGLYFISAELFDNRVHDKKMVIIYWFYRVFFIIALSVAALSHRKVASVGTWYLPCSGKQYEALCITGLSYSSGTRRLY